MSDDLILAALAALDAKLDRLSQEMARGFAQIELLVASGDGFNKIDRFDAPAVHTAIDDSMARIREAIEKRKLSPPGSTT
jgi:hypothetical protein